MTQQSRPNAQTALLLTRPTAQSQRFASEIAARFGPRDIVISPLLAPRFLPARLPAQADRVIFTSETGVAAATAAGAIAQGHLAYCVGTRTAAAARAVGYDACDAGGDWRDVVAMVNQRGARQSLLFLCAQEAAAQLQTALTAAGHTIARIEVYAQDALPLTPKAIALLGGTRPLLLPLFSPRSAQVFCAQARPQAPLIVAALSPAVAHAFHLPYAKLGVAQRPNAAAMLDVMETLLS